MGRFFLLVVAVIPTLFGAGSASFEELASQAASARDGNHVPEAMSLYRQALSVNPAWQEGWWYLGTLAYDANQYSEGRDAFARLAELDKNAAPAWSFLGLCEYETGDYTASLEHIRQGLALANGNLTDIDPVLRFHEALLLVRLGLFDQAIEKYLPFARQGSSNPALLGGIGLAVLRIPLLPADVPPEQRQLVMMAGNIGYLWMSGDNTNTETGFQHLLAAFPDVPRVHYFYGTYLAQTRPWEAPEQFQRELSVNPESADAEAMLALSLIRKGDETGAMPLAKKAAETGPSAPMARYVYGLLLSRAGDPKAVANLEAAEKLDPHNLEYRLALASAYSRFGRYDDARRERLDSLEMAHK